jgi:hypothetical protein
MELVAIRTGRKITAYKYRDVLITRNDDEGVTLWEWTKTRLDGPVLCQAKTKSEITEQIDKSLKKGLRDWHARLVEYVAHDGNLIDARLIEVNNGAL